MTKPATDFRSWLRHKAAHDAQVERAPIISTFMAEVFDYGDPWSSAMLAFFDVAELLDSEGERVPASWRYAAGAGGSRDVKEMQEEGSIIAELYASGQVSAKELTALGDFLDEVTDEMRERGLSY